MIEHRHHNDLKAIHLPCLLDLGYFIYRGDTRELSDDEARVQIPVLVYPGARAPQHGQSAVLTLELPGTHARDGLPRENLKILCKVAYISNIVIGLHLNTQAFNEEQHNLYEDVLEIPA